MKLPKIRVKKVFQEYMPIFRKIDKIYENIFKK